MMEIKNKLMKMKKISIRKESRVIRMEKLLNIRFKLR